MHSFFFSCDADHLDLHVLTPPFPTRRSSDLTPNSVAGAMAGVLRQEGVVEVQVVGAGALNQAIKAVAIARGYVASGGLDLVCVPTFADIEIDGERRTAIRLVIEDRERRRPRSEEHTSELQSLMRNSYAVF